MSDLSSVAKYDLSLCFEAVEMVVVVCVGRDVCSFICVGSNWTQSSTATIIGWDGSAVFEVLPKLGLWLEFWWCHRCRCCCRCSSFASSLCFWRNNLRRFLYTILEDAGLAPSRSPPPTLEYEKDVEEEVPWDGDGDVEDFLDVSDDDVDTDTDSDFDPSSSSSSDDDTDIDSDFHPVSSSDVDTDTDTETDTDLDPIVCSSSDVEEFDISPCDEPNNET